MLKNKPDISLWSDGSCFGKQKKTREQRVVLIENEWSLHILKSMGHNPAKIVNIQDPFIYNCS